MESLTPPPTSQQEAARIVNQARQPERDYLLRRGYVEAIAEALSTAFTSGWRQGVEAAAKVAETWSQDVRFDKDLVRYDELQDNFVIKVRGTQIAAICRALPPPGKEP